MNFCKSLPVVIVLISLTTSMTAAAAKRSCVGFFGVKLKKRPSKKEHQFHEQVLSIERQLDEVADSDPEFTRHATAVLKKLREKAGDLSINTERPLSIPEVGTKALGRALWVAGPEIDPKWNNKSAIFSPSGSELLYFTRNGTTRSDYAAGKVEYLHPRNVFNAHHLQISDDGRFLLVTYTNTWTETYIMDLESGDFIWREQYARIVVMSPDASLVAYAFGEKHSQIFVQDLTRLTAKPVSFEPPPEMYATFRFSSDKRTLLVLTQPSGHSTLTKISLIDGSRTSETLAGRYVFTDENQMMQIEDGLVHHSHGANGWIERRGFDLKFVRGYRKLEIRRGSTGELLQTIEIPDSVHFEFEVSRDARSIAILPQDHAYNAKNPPIIIYKLLDTI